MMVINSLASIFISNIFFILDDNAIVLNYGRGYALKFFVEACKKLLLMWTKLR
jgi:hypothetical protein